MTWFSWLYVLVAVEWGVMAWVMQTRLHPELPRWFNFLVAVGNAILLPVAIPFAIYRILTDGDDDDGEAHFC